MSPFIEKAAAKLHAAADRDRDGKITRQDAQLVIEQLQAEATAATARATPLGALFIAALVGVLAGVFAHIIWAAL